MSLSNTTCWVGYACIPERWCSGALPEFAYEKLHKIRIGNIKLYHHKPRLHPLLYIANRWLAAQILIHFCLAPYFSNWFSAFQNLASLGIYEALATLSLHSMWQRVPLDCICICHIAKSLPCFFTRLNIYLACVSIWIKGPGSDIFSVYFTHESMLI